MKNLGRIAAAALAFLVASNCTRRVQVAVPGAPPPPAVAGSRCRSVDGLPDPVCTPGTINPDVTQSNIFQTICVPGYTATIRPPVSYTNRLKKQQIVQYGFTDPYLRNYEEDHLIPLELGGAPRDAGNLWPEPGKSPNAKDSVERKLHSLVCSGQMPLAEARERIRSNWKTALKP